MVDKKVHEDLHSFLFYFTEAKDDKDAKDESKLVDDEIDTSEAVSKAEECKELVGTINNVLICLY